MSQDTFSNTETPIRSTVASETLCTLTVIETETRRIVSVGDFPDATAARAHFRSLVGDFDAVIRTPAYNELLLKVT
jgi:hypothetical protein